MSKFEMLCNEYRENKRMLEELQAILDGLKADIIAEMNGSDTMIVGTCKATNKPVNSSRFDSKAFSTKYPELYSEYSKQTSYNRFTVI